MKEFAGDRSVYSIDYRGYTSLNPGTTSEKALIQDAVALVKYAYEKENKKVILFGFSLGTAVAIGAAEQCPDMVAKAVLANPLATLHGTVLNMPVLGWPARLWFWAVMIALDPYKSEARLASPAFEKIPLLVMSNEEDEIIDPAQHKRVYDASKCGDSLWIESYGGHNVWQVQ